VRAMGFLQTHASVRAVDVEVAMPGKLLLRVDLRSGVVAFRGLMRSSKVLQPLGAALLPGATGADGQSQPPEAVERFMLKR
jgi:hypothetical protein